MQLPLHDRAILYSNEVNFTEEFVIAGALVSLLVKNCRNDLGNWIHPVPVPGLLPQQLLPFRNYLVQTKWLRNVVHYLPYYLVFFQLYYLFLTKFLEGIAEHHLSASNHAPPSAVRGKLLRILIIIGSSLFGGTLLVKRREASAIRGPDNALEQIVEHVSWIHFPLIVEELSPDWVVAVEVHFRVSQNFYPTVIEQKSHVVQLMQNSFFELSVLRGLSFIVLLGLLLFNLLLLNVVVFDLHFGQIIQFHVRVPYRNVRVV